MSLFDSEAGPAEPLAPEFTRVDDPPGDALVCQEPGCGTILTYSGRGRRPTKCDVHKRGASSSGTSTRRGSVSDKELELACNNLEQLYNALCIPFTMLQPHAGEVWADQIPGLDARNHAILANNKDLVKRINSVGERGGTFAFMLSHVVAVAPVAVVLAQSAREARAARAAAYAEQYPDGFDAMNNGTPFVDPDAAFAR